MRDQTLTFYDFVEGIKGEKKGSYTLNRFSVVEMDTSPLDDPVPNSNSENPSTSSVSTSPSISSPSSNLKPAPTTSGNPGGVRSSRHSLCNNPSGKAFFSVKGIGMEETMLLDSELNLAATSMESAMGWIAAIGRGITGDIFRHMSDKYALGEVVTKRFNPAVRFAVEIVYNSHNKVPPVIIPGLQPQEDHILNSIEALGVNPPTVHIKEGTTAGSPSSMLAASLYTLLLVNPDFKWKGGDAKDNFIHWVEVNTTITPTGKFATSPQGTVCEYVPPCPTYNSGTNRMVLLVFQQSVEIPDAGLKQLSRCMSRFSSFESQDLLHQLKAQCLVALNCFNCMWEPFVDATLDSIGLDPHPNYKSAKDDNVDLSGAQFLKIVSSMRRSEAKVEHLERMLAKELEFKRAAHEQFQEFSARLDEERLTTLQELEELKTRAETATRQWELSEAALGALRRMTSESTVDTAARIQELEAKVKTLEEKLAVEAGNRDSIQASFQALYDKFAYAKVQFEKQVLGDESKYGPRVRQEMKFFVDFLVKSNVEQKAKVDNVLVENARVKGHFDDYQQTISRQEQQIAELKEKIQQGEADNAVLRAATNSSQSGYLAEMESLQAQIRQLQYHLKEEKQTVERLRNEAIAQQRRIDSFSTDTTKYKEKLAEEIKKAREGFAGEITDLQKVVAEKDVELDRLRAEIAAEKDRSIRFESDREQEQEVGNKLRATLKGQEQLMVTKEKELAAATADVAKLRAEMNNKQQQVEKKVQELAEMQATVAVIRDNEAKLQQTVASLEATVSRKDSEVSKAQADVARVRDELSQEIAALQEQLKQAMDNKGKAELEVVKDEPGAAESDAVAPADADGAPAVPDAAESSEVA